MGKILFWFVIIMAVLLGARLLARGAHKAASGARPAAKAGGDRPNMQNAEAMVRCQHCGIHLPRSEAFLSQGQTWCGPEHARVGQNSSDSRSG